MYNILFIIMSSKQDIISNTYFDRAGYGSRATTLADARKRDNTITMDDVNKFFSEHIEEKRKPRGENSFVAPHAYFEYQLDLFFMAKNDFDDEQKFRVGLVLIDIFSKYAVVIPITSKNPPDVLGGIMEGIQKMDKKPKMIYSDEEGSLLGNEIREYFKKEGIELHTTRGHPAFAERFIRTFKDMLFKRVDADEKKSKKNIQWTDYIFEVMLTYNNKMVSSVTKFTPRDARMKKNEFDVKMNISLQAKKSRTYPDVEVSDRVKVMRKKAITEKERSSHWLKEIFIVKKIEKKLGQNYYYLEGRDRPFLRHELLKV